MLSFQLQTAAGFLFAASSSACPRVAAATATAAFTRRPPAVLASFSTSLQQLSLRHTHRHLHSTSAGGGGGDPSDNTINKENKQDPTTPPKPTTPSPAGTGFQTTTTARKKSGPPPPAGGTPPKKAPPAKIPRGTNLLIVGLGNPGKEYTMTRHNAGFLVIDELARRLGADLKLRSAFQGEYGSASYAGKSIGLLKPTTFMNNSGQSLRKVLEYYKLPLSSVLVIVDEVALELGQIRLRQTGSAGGHNGLKSIESYIKSKDYNRLRVGVGGAQPGRMVDHVLGEFSRSERKQLEEVIMDALEAVDLWIEEDDTDKVMNKVNAPR